MRRIALLTLATVCLLPTLALSQSRGPQSRVPQPRRPATVNRPRPADVPRMIAVEVMIVQTRGEADDERIVDLSGPSDQVAARLLEMEAAGQLDVIDRARLSTLENQHALVQIGRTISVPSGRQTVSRGFPSRTTYEQRSVGTLVSVTARVDGETVVMELEVEKSQLRQPTHSRDDDFVVPQTDSTTTQASVSIPSGMTLIVGAMQSRADSGTSQMLILASARVLDPPRRMDRRTGAATGQLRIFALQNAQAEAVGDVLREVYQSQGGQMRMEVDARTNSLIVEAEPSRLAEIEALLLHLDKIVR